LIKPTHHNDLDLVAECHILAFPGSLSSALGKKYVSKMLTWYLESDRKFLFHHEENGKVIGYCGGILNDEFSTETSSSGMLQNSIEDAFYGILKRPRLLFHKEIIRRYPLILINIKRKLFGVSKERVDKWKQKLKESDPYLGLIVIGVSKKNQGNGIGTSLLQEFEKYALHYGVKKLSLTVNSKNYWAIGSYKKNGWSIGSQSGYSTQMIKILE
jgi:ribosomal protein S18 acetylase RimI-like enzyme